MKILIAENSLGSQEILQRLFLGHELIFVESIAELKEMGSKIAQGEFDAIILDDNLTDGSCFRSGTAQWVREQNKSISIALNSSGPCPDLVDWIGAVDLTKRKDKIRIWRDAIQWEPPRNDQ